MDPLEQIISAFEGDAERLVWLPCLTLGYIYTLSGYLPDFALAVLSVAGARIFMDIFGSDEILNSETRGGATEDLGNWILPTNGRFKAVIGTALFAYAIALVWGLIRLGTFFTSSNIILVGLAGIYWGSLVIVALNGLR